ncbi:NACHT domain-containing protein [Cohnella panacarvi]|uniref:NACHT domain-containing protein n=1 Tax=Cohnella panacarvi TaxID=400776 RepID=UPI00047BF539|nr:NACHT domain-containing protein [Cohnella panacarvi]
MKHQKTLSELVDYLKENENESTKDRINSLADCLITSGTIASVLLAPDIPAAIENLSTGVGLMSMKPGNILNHLSNNLNYQDKCRELNAREQADKLSLAHLILIHLAARDSFIDRLLPVFHGHADRIDITDEDRLELMKLEQETYQYLADVEVSLPANGDQSGVDNYLEQIFRPLGKVFLDFIVRDSVKEDDNLTIIEESIRIAKHYYNAYLLSLVEEFPEFGWWVDLSEKEHFLGIWKDKITETAEMAAGIESKLNKIIAQIELLHKDEFTGSFSLQPPPLKDVPWLTRHTLSLSECGSNERLDKIAAHHNILRKYAGKTIISNDDLAGMANPTNEQMYIPQSYTLIQYSGKSKNYLSSEFWEDASNGIVRGENIGSQLHRSLMEPLNAHKPILILGNPGAGKSMLSQMLASQLCDHKDFVPFFIKLRDVRSSHSDVKSHIDEGLKQSIEAGAAVDWFDWAKEFQNRIPVVILDGFDELLQVSATELNGYLTKIQQFQEKAYDMHNICLRVIITSRLSIMQEVRIPEGTIIIKLNSFDKKRKDQWVERWNRIQRKDGFKRFQIPENEHMEELSKEPLLLLLLAIYDYQHSELQEDAKDADFNRSKLYDKLFIKFTLRQLNKDQDFIDLTLLQQEKEMENFRLRIGLIAFMMFIHDETSHSGKDLTKELQEFGLGDHELDAKKIFGGFFFIHENKATGQTGNELYHYEFLHKTFGEFLTADFLLRIAQKRGEREDSALGDEQTFRFCYGYNWLHKHTKIVSFFMEHAHNVISENNSELRKWIKNEFAKSVKGTGQLPFPANGINLISPKPILEHLAIYTQNMVLLLLALSEDAAIDVTLNIFSETGEGIRNIASGVEASGRMTQDEWPVTGEFLWWTKMVELWNLAGNHLAAGKLSEWADVRIDSGRLRLFKKSHREIHDYFGSYAAVSKNDYHTLLNYYYSNEVDLERIGQIVLKKQGMIPLALDVLHTRYDYILRRKNIPEREFINWLQSIFDFSSEEFTSSRLMARFLRSQDVRKFSKHFWERWVYLNLDSGTDYIDVLERLQRGHPNFWWIIELVMPAVLTEASPSQRLRLLSLLITSHLDSKYTLRYAGDLIESLLNDTVHNDDTIEILKLISRINMNLQGRIMEVVRRTFYKIDFHDLGGKQQLELFELALVFGIDDACRYYYDVLYKEFYDSNRLPVELFIRFVELCIASRIFEGPDMDNQFGESKYYEYMNRKHSSSLMKHHELDIKYLELLIKRFGDTEENCARASELLDLIDYKKGNNHKSIHGEMMIRLMECIFIHGKILSNYGQLIQKFLHHFNWHAPGRIYEKTMLLVNIDLYSHKHKVEIPYLLKNMMHQLQLEDKGRLSPAQAYEMKTKLLELARRYDIAYELL